MHYGNIKYNAIEDGIGCRTALFVSGCRNRCPGCFQPETWNFGYGKEFTEDVEDDIIASLQKCYVRGLSLLGGEPFEPENQAALLPFLTRVRIESPESDVWAYTGYTYEELMDESHPVHTANTKPMLEMIDILVDGKFDEAKKSVVLPYRGSSNQRVIDLPMTMKSGKIVLSKYGERTGRSEIIMTKED